MRVLDDPSTGRARASPVSWSTSACQRVGCGAAAASGRAAVARGAVDAQSWPQAAARRRDPVARREQRLELVELRVSALSAAAKPAACDQAAGSTGISARIARGRANTGSAAVKCGSAASRIDQGLGDAATCRSGLAGQQHHLALAAGLPPALSSSASSWSRPTRAPVAAVPRLEPALQRGSPSTAQAAHRLGKPLSDCGPRSRSSNISPTSRRVRSAMTTCAGLGQRLQARGEVRRLADDRLLLRGALADQVADDDQAGGDADARRQRARRAGVEPADRGHDASRRAPRARLRPRAPCGQPK